MKLLIALSVVAVFAVGCSSGGGAPDAAAGAGTVAVDDFSFAPETTEVGTGEEVTWTVAEGSSPHTVKFDDEESKEIAAGDTFSKSFDKAGEYKYVCGIHPQMTGAVTVK